MSHLPLDLIQEYSQQYQWRDWETVFERLPLRQQHLGKRPELVLDLGCGIGDLAADLCRLGANVIGIDSNEQMISYARSREIDGAEFRAADLHSFCDPELKANGIWSSFTAAYFPDLTRQLKKWSDHLLPDGWITLIEVDDLFAHGPTSPNTHRLLDSYVESSINAKRYDFRMGRKLSDCFRKAKFIVEHEFAIPDQELSFSGRAPAGVIEAWRRRFERMRLLREHCGADSEAVVGEFLDCLTRDDHTCDATVQCVIARSQQP